MTNRMPRPRRRLPAPGSRAAVVTCLVLAPAVFAGSFLWTLWRPATTAPVRAAVVNLDSPVEVDGEPLALGRELVGALTAQNGQAERDRGAEPDRGTTASGTADPVSGTTGDPASATDVLGLRPRLEWTLTDAATADRGLREGKYAAVLRIPREFSARAASLAGPDAGSARKAELDIRRASSGALLDSTVADSVGAAAVTALGDRVTAAYLDNVLLGFSQVHERVSDAGKGTRALSDGATGLRDGLSEVDGGAAELTIGLGDLVGGARSLSDRGRILVDGAGSVRRGASDLSAAIVGLHDGTRTLAQRSDEVADGVEELARSARALRAGTRGLPASLDGARRASGQVGSDLGRLLGTSSSVRSSHGELDTALDSAADSLAAARRRCAARPGADCESLDAALRDLQGARRAAREQDSGLEALGQGLSGARRSVSDLNRELGTATRAAGTADGGLRSLETASARAASASRGIATGTRGLSSGAEKGADRTVELARATRRLEQGAGSLARSIDSLGRGASDAGTGIEELRDSTARLGSGASQVASGARRLASEMDRAAGELPSLTEQERARLTDVAAAPVTAAGDGGGRQRDAGAAYFLLVGLALTAAAAFTFLRATPRRAVTSSRSSLRLATGSWAPIAALAAGQSVILSVVAGAVLDLGAARALTTAAAVTAAAVAIWTVTQGLAALLGGWGKLVAALAVVVAAPAALASTAPAWVQVPFRLTPLSPALTVVQGGLCGRWEAGALVQLVVWAGLGLAATVIGVARLRSVGPRALRRMADAPGGDAGPVPGLFLGGPPERVAQTLPAGPGGR